MMRSAPRVCPYAHAFLIINVWQSMHGFMFLPRPRFGCFTIARKSASIGRVTSSIANCSAAFSALLLPVHGRGQYAPAKFTPMTVMPCLRITFADRVESSPPDSSAMAITFGLSVTRRE
jgi:hypothetical protein